MTILKRIKRIINSLYFQNNYINENKGYFLKTFFREISQEMILFIGYKSQVNLVIHHSIIS